MKTPLFIDKPVLLIGEGKEEELVFSALVRHLKLDEEIQVADYRGKHKLLSFLESWPVYPGFSRLTALGITRDADNDYNAALASVNSAIQSAKFPNALRVETFILPKENTHGALEAVILEAAVATPAWPCVTAFAECVAAKENEPISSTEQDKRKLHAWLSTLSRPALRLGEAANAGLIPFDHEAFNPLKDFITRLT